MHNCLFINNMYVTLLLRHVSSINMPIFRRKKFIHTASCIVALCKWLHTALNRHTVQPFTERDDNRCCVNTIFPPEDGKVNAPNMSRIIVWHTYCYWIKNCALKLVNEIILYYDAGQKKHQTRTPVVSQPLFSLFRSSNAVMPVWGAERILPTGQTPHQPKILELTVLFALHFPSVIKQFATRSYDSVSRSFPHLLAPQSSVRAHIATHLFPTNPNL